MRPLFFVIALLMGYNATAFRRPAFITAAASKFNEIEKKVSHTISEVIDNAIKVDIIALREAKVVGISNEKTQSDENNAAIMEGTPKIEPATSSSDEKAVPSTHEKAGPVFILSSGYVVKSE